MSRIAGVGRLGEGWRFVAREITTGVIEDVSKKKGAASNTAPVVRYPFNIALAPKIIPKHPARAFSSQPPVNFTPTPGSKNSTPNTAKEDRKLMAGALALASVPVVVHHYLGGDSKDIVHTL